MSNEVILMNVKLLRVGQVTRLKMKKKSMRIWHSPRKALTPNVPRAMDNIIAKTDT